ncbi:MAG TPA: ABC transporter substrate-binding protein [Ktedonobacterales bacterium]|nr:ABC transporter substrate-binding protein [Ktedonobacterales bacterium]
MRTSVSVRSHLAGVLVLLAVLATLAACGGSASAPPAPEKPLLAKDAIGSAITIPASAPQRIVSETPADSEILAALGVNSRVIAVDFYTDFPADLAAKPKITDGQTFNLNDEAILGYKPDLVLGYGGYFKSDEQKLGAAHIAVVDLPLVASLADSLTELKLVGQLVHADAKASSVASALQQRITAVTSKVAGAQPVSVYMEDGTYNGQYSTFGAGSYGDELIRDAGGTNIFASDADSGGYPNVSAEAIVKANPQVIILTEGTQFGGDPKAASARPGWSVIAAVRTNRVYAVTPNDFSRPDAVRLVSALEDLAKVLHPDLFA